MDFELGEWLRRSSGSGIGSVGNTRIDLRVNLDVGSTWYTLDADPKHVQIAFANSFADFGFGKNLMGNMQSVITQLQEKDELVKRELQKNMTDKFSEFFAIMQEMRQEQIAAEHSEQIHRDIQRSALEIVGRDPNRYTADQIAIDVMDRTKAARVIVMIQIISLLQNGILTQDGEGRVSIRLFQLPDKVLSPPAHETEKIVKVA
jgi:hypothetical protein